MEWSNTFEGVRSSLAVCLGVCPFITTSVLVWAHGG